MALVRADHASLAICSAPSTFPKKVTSPMVNCSVKDFSSSTYRRDIGQFRKGRVSLLRQHVTGHQSERRWRGTGGALVTCMGIRAVENFDTTFELTPQCEEVLLQLLKSDTFAKQVAEQAGMEEGSRCTYTGNLFQPVPWSPNTPFGMPRELEKYVQDKEQYVVINVPPNFMFQAKIFKPSRLCAIYKKGGEAPA